MPPKRRLGPSTRQPPQLDDELVAGTPADVADHDELEDVIWTGGSPPNARGVELTRARLTGVSFIGLELEGWRLRDVELIECELSGAVLAGAQWERVVIRRCRLSGLVAAELKASDLLVQDSKADQAWLRAAVLDRCELIDTDLHDADLYGAQVSRSAFRRCDLTGLDVTASHFEEVSLHGSTVDRLKGADSLRGCAIGSDQIASLALPIFGTRGIVVDDDPPDLADQLRSGR